MNLNKLLEEEDFFFFSERETRNGCGLVIGLQSAVLYSLKKSRNESNRAKKEIQIQKGKKEQKKKNRYIYAYRKGGRLAAKKKFNCSSQGALVLPLLNLSSQGRRNTSETNDDDAISRIGKLIFFFLKEKVECVTYDLLQRSSYVLMNSRINYIEAKRAGREIKKNFAAK